MGEQRSDITGRASLTPQHTHLAKTLAAHVVIGAGTGGTCAILKVVLAEKRFCREGGWARMGGSDTTFCTAARQPEKDGCSECKTSRAEWPSFPHEKMCPRLTGDADAIRVERWWLVLDAPL